MIANNNTARFAALADPTRCKIFERLAKGPLPVGKLAAGLPVSRPAVSQHLKVLEDARLVRHEEQGARHLYRVDPQGVKAMRDYLDRFWSQALAAFKAAAEEKEKDT